MDATDAHQESWHLRGSAWRSGLLVLETELSCSCQRVAAPQAPQPPQRVQRHARHALQTRRARSEAQTSRRKSWRIPPVERVDMQTPTLC